MGSHRRYLTIAPLVNTTNIGLTQFAHPIGIAAETLHPQSGSQIGPRLFQHIQAGPQEQIYAYSRQLPADHRSNSSDQLWIPCCTQSHLRRKSRKPLA